jgi:hypothetical protein
MNQGTKTLIKILVVCAVFFPYKYMYMQGRSAGFLQDMMVAAAAYALAMGAIYLIERGKGGDA